jgi:hypothetical protein
MRFKLPAVALTVLALLLACHQAILVAPPESTIFLVANPPFVMSNGGVSVVSALLVEPAGTPVPDGTVVQFFTSLGQIPEQGRTNDGVARVNFVADSRSGLARVTAFSGAQNSSVEIAIGTRLPKTVFLTANPPRITESRSTHVTATVVDSDGNPVPNVPVIFDVTTNPATEFMDSAGRALYTDTSGRAQDVMRTRRTASGTATVRARVLVAGDLTATVNVSIVLD